MAMAILRQGWIEELHTEFDFKDKDLSDKKPRNDKEKNQYEDR